MVIFNIPQFLLKGETLTPVWVSPTVRWHGANRTVSNRQDMMTHNDAKTPVLIVWPPMASPAAPPARVRHWAAAVSAAGRPAAVFDANRVFYESLPACATTKAQDGGGCPVRRLLAADPPAVDDAPPLLAALHKRLASASVRSAPTALGCGWVCCPTLAGPGRVPAFVRDRCVNPFVELAEGDFSRRIFAGTFSAVVFFVTDAVQCPAALTLAAACRRAAPGLDRVLLAPVGLAAALAPFFDQTADVEQPPGADLLFERLPRGERHSRRPFPLPSESGASAAAAVDPPVIRWRVEENDPLPAAEKRKTAAADGYWNHLDLFEAHGEEARLSAPADLSAVHSFCWWRPEAYGPAGARQIWPERIEGYTGVRPLPGAPFWCRVKDPILLGAWLTAMTPAELMRLRIDEQHGAVFRLGDALDYRFAPPDELTPEEMDEVCRMVIAGGSVAAKWVRHNLQRAFLIGMATERGVIAANSSLKHPRQEYIETVSRAAGIDLSGFLERGYTSVRPEYRGLGIGTRLLEGLTARARGYKIFSIIGEDNLATQKIAIRNRTRKVATFHSRALEKPVGLWMPEQTADEIAADRKTK